MSRGCHVVTREVLRQVPEIQEYEIGTANFFILHTSASLTISENASPDVPLDMAVRSLSCVVCQSVNTCWWAAFALPKQKLRQTFQATKSQFQGFVGACRTLWTEWCQRENFTAILMRGW